MSSGKGVTAAERATPPPPQLLLEPHPGKLLNQHYEVVGSAGLSRLESLSKGLWRRRLRGAAPGFPRLAPKLRGSFGSGIRARSGHPLRTSHLNALSCRDSHPPPARPPPRAGAAEVAPGVQIALQTSPQPPRTQPPPGGPSGKLERDSVCRSPWGGSGGGEGRTTAHAPSPVLPAPTRGGDGGPATKPRARNSARGAGEAEGQRLPRRGRPPHPRPSPFHPKKRLSDHPGSRGAKEGAAANPSAPPPRRRRQGEGTSLSGWVPTEPPKSAAASSQPVAPAQLRAPFPIPKAGVGVRKGEPQKKKWESPIQGPRGWRQRAELLPWACLQSRNRVSDWCRHPQ